MTSVLFTSKNFEFTTKHLLLIGILCSAFMISFLIRIEPLQFGFELNEFDPFFNYRATKYMVENGFSAYFSWHDELSWYPYGRDVSSNSQVMLHITTATLYSIFGNGTSLYAFTIIFPAIIGSLTTIVIFALVRVFAGTSAGLFASLFFAVSPSIIIRGSAGWFKSEPLGLFYGLLALFLFFNALQSKNRKFIIIKLVGSGLLLTFGLASWGGVQFFLIPVGLYLLTIPFLRNDPKFTIYAIPLFVTTIILSSLLFERPGLTFVSGLGGILLIIPTLFIIGCYFIQFKNKQHQKRNYAFFLISIVLFCGIILLIGNTSHLIPLPSHRYLNAINPFLTTTDPLVDSVSEHSSNSINQSFFFESFLMILAGIGAWLIFRNFQKNSFPIKNDFAAFMLIFGFLGVYISSAFIRLEIFSSLAVIILASVSLSILTHMFFLKNRFTKKIPIFCFVIIMIFFVVTPTIFPNAPNWINASSVPPTILNGGSKFILSTSDWTDSMNWIKNNTPEDSTILSWWDYGYWIETLGERKTFADNATVDTTIIKKTAQIFFSNPDDAWKSLRDMKADYVLVFVSGQRLQVDNPIPLYVLDGGGEESKKQWILRISGYPFSKYLYDDGMSGTDEFWNNTLLGNLIPYSTVAYTNLNSQSETYQPGMFAVYAKNIKYPDDGNDPFKLVYASKSINDTKPGAVVGVLIYQINPDYIPAQ